MNPVIVVVWDNTCRVLERCLPALRGTAPELEWHLIYNRYPLLKAIDAIPEARQARNLCVELNIVWNDLGQELEPYAAISKWACEVSKGWTPGRDVISVPCDSILPPSWTQSLTSGKPQHIYSPANEHSDVSQVQLEAALRGIWPATKLVKGVSNTGGPVSRGGSIEDHFYDAEWLSWSGVGLFTEHLKAAGERQ